MPGHNGEEPLGRIRIDKTQTIFAHPAVFAGLTFVLGLITGLFLTGDLKRMYERTRGRIWDRERIVTYNQNLPASLSRREPAPHAGQIRFGGTGAIGVSPAAVVTPQPEETKGRG